MDRLVERCAGLDVHGDSVTACVRIPGERGEREQHTQQFGTTTVQLLALRDWLASYGVTLVGMESTGVYWKPVYYVLEDDFECWLLNAQHLRNVPGRKTDVADATWICQLVEHGLVRPSFVPPQQIRDLRDLTRYRKTLINQRGSEAQRLEKMLQDAGVKLSSVATNITGVSGRAMLKALVEGTHDPEMLAALAKGVLRRKLPALKEALAGKFRPHHALIVSEILSHIDYIDEAIERLGQEVDRLVAPFAHKIELLDTIPGVNRRTAEVLLAEIGSGHEPVPNPSSSRVVGGDVSGEQRVRRQAPVGTHAQGIEVVADCVGRIRQGRIAILRLSELSLYRVPPQTICLASNPWLFTSPTPLLGRSPSPRTRSTIRNNRGGRCSSLCPWEPMMLSPSQPIRQQTSKSSSPSQPESMF